MTNEERAERFARRVRHIRRFVTTDPVARELYGVATAVLNVKLAEKYYNSYEPNRARRDFETFRDVLEERIERLNDPR